MDRPVFDAMMKTALEEAALEELNAPEKMAIQRLSLRQRRRMCRMRADPHRYARCAAASESTAESGRRSLSTRWLLPAVIAALLAGTATGYALRGGDFFRQMFDKSPWTVEYGEAADTEQLLDMGGGNVGTMLEDETFRFELLDAISEGESAIAAVRITVLDTKMLEDAFHSVTVAPALFLRQDGTFFESGSSSIEYIYADQDPKLEKNQFLLIFRSVGNTMSQGRTATIVFHDFGYHQYENEEDAEGTEIVLVPGDWTLEMKLSFDGGTVLKKNETVQVENSAFTVNEIRISALSVSMVLHCTWEGSDAVSETLQRAEFRMKDGTQVPATSYRFGGLGEDADGFACEVQYEFGMPLKKEEIIAIVFGKQALSLQK